MMPLIEWHSDLSVGIQEIDEQHKVLIGLLNEINEAIQQRRGKAVAKTVLDKLIDYTRIHFAVEESIMRILNYPGYEEHKEVHTTLMDGVTSLSKKLENENLAIGFELQNFLKNWLIKHILTTDKHYTEHFLKTGAQAKLRSSKWISSLWQ
jgi:hemerythrin